MNSITAFCRDEEDSADKKEISDAQLESCFAKIRDAIEDLDMDQMEEVIREMERYQYDEWQQELFEQLKYAADEMDVDQCETILNDWEGQLKKVELT